MQEKWEIVKTTKTYSYFDCGLHRTLESNEYAQYYEKRTSWIAKIEGLHATYGIDRHFLDCRAFKDVIGTNAEDSKFVPITAEIYKGVILELGFKRQTNDGYPMSPETSKGYYRVDEITDKEVIVTAITLSEVKDTFRGHDFENRKIKLMKALRDCETDEQIYEFLDRYSNLYRLKVKTDLLKNKEEN